MLKDRIVLLSSTEAVEAFLERFPTSVIFKAGTCHKTMQGFGFVQENLEPREDLMCGVIRVVEARPASNLVEAKTGIRHESPQVILFENGKAVFDVDNWDITPESVAAGFQKLPVGEPVAESAPSAGSDLRDYIDLLEQYLQGNISEEQFEYTYTHKFRADATLRPNDEVEALNSIFGDIDQHMNMHRMMDGTADNSKLRERAQAAYTRLMEIRDGAAIA